MPTAEFTMRARVWIYPGMAGWHFVTLPKKPSARIKQQFATVRRGWGSLPVIAKVGKTSWKTSIFPAKESEAYVLPLKADVRKKEKIVAESHITIRLQISS